MSNSNRTPEVLLINPPPRHRRDMHDAPGHPHLGLAYLGAYLKGRGLGCAAIDAKFEGLDLAGVEKRLRNLGQPPGVVGITAMTHEISQAHLVAQTVKTTWPGVMTVVGGAHATALPRLTLEEFPQFDIAVSGEGEKPFFEIVSSLKQPSVSHGVRGTCYREGTSVNCQDGSGESPINLAELPHPAWDIFPRSRTYPIMTTRGCPFRCNFCMRVLSNRVRKRTPQDVVGELEENIQVYGADTFIFDDECFTIDKKYALAILDLMIARELPRKIRWWCNTRVDLIDLELLRKMKAAGCTWVGFGVESGNAAILKASQKGITLKQAEAAVGMAKTAGLKTGSYFILGHPCETRATIRDTIDFATRLNTTTVAFGIMVPYPGTEIYQMAKRGEGGYKIISDNWADYNKTIGNSLELTTVSRMQLEMLQLWAYFKVYVYNFRLIDFIKLFWGQWRVLFSVSYKILAGGLNHLKGSR